MGSKMKLITTILLLTTLASATDMDKCKATFDSFSGAFEDRIAYLKKAIEIGRDPINDSLYIDIIKLNALSVTLVCPVSSSHK